MKRSSLVLILSFATLCLLIAAGCSRTSTNDNSVATTPAAANSATPKPTTNRPAPDFTVTATDLYKEMQADRKKAVEKYGGKQIAVTGRVLTMNLSQTPMRVLLRAGGLTEFVACQFGEEEKEGVAALLREQDVTLQGLSEDYWIGSPSLKQCTIVNVAKD
jgi:uncharacterized protein (DUF1330 family)